MGKRIFSVAAMTFVWAILTESFAWLNLLVGAGIGLSCLIFVAKFLPTKAIANVNFLHLITFPLFLIGQIYLAGFYVVSIVLQGHKVGVVTLRTKLESEALKIILVDSVTLTPGSILLNLDGDKITLLWLRSKKTPFDPQIADEHLKGKLERRLLKAQK